MGIRLGLGPMRKFHQQLIRYKNVSERITYPAGCKRDEEYVKKGNSNTAHDRLACMLCRTRRDNGQADAHQNTTCNEELASTPFVDHA